MEINAGSLSESVGGLSEAPTTSIGGPQDEAGKKRKRKSKRPPPFQVTLGELVAILEADPTEKSSKKSKRKSRRLALSIDLEELMTLVDTTEAQYLDQGERKILKAAYLAMYAALHPRPRSSEKQSDVTDCPQESPKSAPSEKKPTSQRGRHGPDDYPEAERLPVELEGITEGQDCPCGCGGKLSRKPNSDILQFVGQVPIRPVVREPSASLLG